MGFFETLKENITETGRIVAEKTKLAKDIVILKDQIRNNKKEIRNLTFKIGQTYMELHPDDYEEAFADFIRGIGEAKDELKERMAELETLKEQIKVIDPNADTADILDEEDDELFGVEETKEVVEEAVETVEEAAEAVEEVAEEAAETVEEVAEEAVETVEEVAEEAAETVEEVVEEATEE